MRFNIAQHSVTGNQMVEVFMGERLVGCVYGDAGIPALKVVSKYLMPGEAIQDHVFPSSVLIPLTVKD